MTPERAVAMALPYYVYALKDPRTSPAKPFYIGKGIGTRAWDHAMKVDETNKGRRIAEIRAAGYDIIVSVLLDDLSEHQALKMEAEIVAAFGIEANGGILTNTVAPSGKGARSRPDLVIPSGAPETAAIALSLLKDSILALAQANANGITNADAANSLGLKSSFSGGSKDYLTFSVIGLLLDEGKLVRDEQLGKGRYRSSSKQ